MFPLVGHRHLNTLMEKIYPKWENYLLREDKNIFQFVEELNCSEELNDFISNLNEQTFKKF